MELTAVFIQVPEGHVAFVEEKPGANTQGATLEEARENLREAVAMVLEANRELSERSLTGQTVTKEPFVLCAVKRLDLIRHLESHGCHLLHDSGKHSDYVNPVNNQVSAVPMHREIYDFLASNICRDLRIAEP